MEPKRASEIRAKAPKVRKKTEGFEKGYIGFSNRKDIISELEIERLYPDTHKDLLITKKLIHEAIESHIIDVLSQHGLLTNND